ncbi:VWA domain-containing protein [Streptomyces sp. NBC_00564]|uniref:VWA domain-containing protein n=1 Tax=Streptomyces sp. NBC_00564 TaxID=2903663 RepID=UPI00352FD81A|nr:VWA domain-containing protein [Streptomyces sp. NBC_00564]
MGILTVLRNAFGRSRKGRDADGETSREVSTPTAPERVPAQETEPRIPAPSTELQPEPAPAAEVPAPATEPKPSVVDELVSAAFDNVTVPPARTPEPEPVIEPEQAETPAPVIEPEPVVEPTPEVVAEAEAPAPAETPEPVVEPEPVVAAEAETEVEAEVETEVKAETAAEPEPITAEEPAPVAAKADEPAAADGDQAPPGPPAADDESVTGGAGGNNDPAEGRVPTPRPEAEDSPEPEPEAEAEPTVPEEPVAAQADEPAAADGDEAPPGPPAADDETVTGGAGGNNDPAEGRVPTPRPEAEETPEPEAEKLTPVAAQADVPASLLTAYTEAATALETQKLTGTSAKVYLVLDRSASMRPYYKDGSAQALGEQTLALAAHLDPEATVHVVFFSTELDGTGELTLTDHENKVDELHADLGRMGRTSYHAAVEEVLTHYQKSDTTAPALVVFQTDGAPDAKTPATQSLTDAAKSHPSVFFSFVAFGETDNKAFDYLRKLKTENTAFFHAGPTPRELTDAEIYEGVLANWRP